LLATRHAVGQFHRARRHIDGAGPAVPQRDAVFAAVVDDAAQVRA